jgi:adenosine deaminase
MTSESATRPRDLFKRLPKIELHRHLEGSLRLSTMIDISKLHKLDLPHDDVEKFRQLVQVVDSDPYTFQNFLSKFATLRKFYQSREAISRIAFEAVEDAASDNVRYLELRFTPVALTRIRDFPLGEAMDWVIETVDEASQRYGIQTGLIASVNRHEPVSLGEEVAQLAVDRMDRGIIGLDLAGGEAEFPGEEFAPLFKQAKDAGLRITIHAGEWGGPSLVNLAMDVLGAERIGHGVRTMEDPDTVAAARERQIPFEVCPTSNYQSGVVTGLHLHPLPAMIAAGLNVTVNTDDPGISQITLTDEYEVSNDQLGIPLGTLKSLILNAVEASFLTKDKKSGLGGSIRTELDVLIPK